MVQKVLTAKRDKRFSSAILLFFEDLKDAINSTGVDVDDGAYDTGSFLDRDYDVRQFATFAVALENIGANSVDYKILSTTKGFTVLDTDLTDDDFDKEEKAETAIAGGSQATGTVDVTGGPSVKADGTLTLVSAVANAFATGTVTCASVEVGDTVTVNGLVYTAVAGSKAGDNTKFSIDTSDDACAADLADSITNDVRAGTTGDQTATSSTNVVTITTDVLGTGGNAITLVSSNGTRLAVSGATLAGGVNADTATVNGLVYTAVAGAKADDTEFSIDTSDNAAATDLADSIDDDVRPPVTVPTIDVVAVAATNVVTVSAPVNDGAAGNAIDLAGTANITADNATLTGGISSTMDGIVVNAIEIMSAAVPFRTSSTLTAEDVAANINAFTSNPNYTANAVAGLITITAVNNESSTDDVTSSTTVLTTTDVNMSGGASGKADIFELTRASQAITAIKIRAKETAPGSPGKIRADIRGL